MSSPKGAPPEQSKPGPTRSTRGTRNQALEAAVRIETAWASAGSSMSMNRVVDGAKLFEAYLNGEEQNDGR